MKVFIITDMMTCDHHTLPQRIFEGKTMRDRGDRFEFV